jgi:two-component system sensor histidine kinase MtrB
MPSRFHRFRKKVHDVFFASLQGRMVLLAIILTLVLAVVFSVVSMASVRSSISDSAAAQSRKDFNELVNQAQKFLDSADTTDRSESQSLLIDLATQLQDQGSPSVSGISLLPQNSKNSSVTPVSTDPNTAGLISSSIRSKVSSSDIGDIFYQAADLAQKSSRSQPEPGAVFGTLLQFPGREEFELFTIYSYRDQQDILLSIERMLSTICICLSLAVGFLVWLVLLSVVKPVSMVASAAKKLSEGDLEARVKTTRSDEIGVLQSSFNTMAETMDSQIEQLEQAGVSQRQFVSDVSHELRTPVTTIRMASDLLLSRKEEFDPSTARTVELLAGQTNRFESMLTDLLEISRYDAGHPSFTPVEEDLRDVVHSSRDMLAGIAKTRGVDIRTTLPQYPVVATYDNSRMVCIVKNLLSNALDFSEGNPIEVMLAETQTSASIAVCDRGTGMTEEQLGHIYDRFWRADASRSRTTGGTGLGLAIVLQDVKLHHGCIEVHSHLGEGSSFIVTVPKDPAESTEDTPPVSALVFLDSTSLDVVRPALQLSAEPQRSEKDGCSS